MPTTAVKTINDLVEEVRDTINDSEEPFRFSNERVLRHVNTALREVYRVRPDAWIGYQSTGVLTSEEIPTYVEADLEADPLEDFPIDDRLFFNACMYFVAGRLELADDEFTEDSRARTLLQAFVATIGG
jgi:hypothetical protein